MVMTVIEQVHADREELARVLKKHKGIRRIVEDLYPDTAHFIYELLQNAEDTGATEASFTLCDSAATFEHNGRPFDESDIWGITNIGEGTKSGHDDQIGQFGIGFKAVFAYTESPHIWSPTYSFKITDLVLPTPIEPNPGLNGKTRFNFPFDSPKKLRAEALDEVKTGLDRLSALTLLFLSHLKVISWHVAGVSAEIRRVVHSEKHIELVKQVGSKRTRSSHLLLFHQPVPSLEKQRVAIAFELGRLANVRRFEPDTPLAKQLAIVPAKRGRVAVYFPAEKETSGLRIHLHAPFVPELSRASIKETGANQPLFKQLARLTANSLHQVRDMGLLTTEFLAVLPNPLDPLPERYECIREAVIDEMKTQPLTPTHSRSHAAAKYLRQAKASLKALLSDDDLEFIGGHEGVRLQWVVSPTPKNSDVHRFLNGLEIDRWDIEHFVNLLREKATSWTAPDEDFMKWLSGKPPEWHQKLYALLYEELKPEDELSELAHVQIVRMSDGSYSVGDKCFFSSDGVQHDVTHPRVDAAVLTSGKNKKEQEKARKFLEEIGVRQVGEAEQVQVILDLRYSELVDIPDRKTYLNDLRRFIQLVEDDPDSATLFDEYWVLETEDRWRKSVEIFLDRPFADTGLHAFHEALPEDHEARRWALSKDYKRHRIANDKLVKFAKAIGVQDELPIEKQPTWQHRLTKELRQDSHSGDTRERHDTKIDEDWIIPGLEQALSAPSKELAKVLWQTLCRIEPQKLKARYRPNRGFDVREQYSSFVLLLQERCWVPQGQNELVCPRDASARRLPKYLEFDPDWPWLDAVGFAENDARVRKARAEKQAMAKKLGFKSIAILERFAAFPPEEQHRILADAEARRFSDRSEDKQRDEGNARMARDSDVGTGRRTTVGQTEAERASNLSGTAQRTSASNRSRQFVSYVAVQPDDEEPDPDGLDHQARMGLEERAIQLILSREPILHRTPTNNLGFDLFEEDSEGEKCRWVEVKAMTGCLNDRPVGMSRTQFDCARKHRAAYCLYIVEYAGDETRARILRIQDPAGKARTFTFDHGWTAIAAVDSPADR